MAAISRMMRVTSCRASHTSARKLLAFLGGMKFFPNEACLFSRSTGLPERPERGRRQNYDPLLIITKCSVCVCAWVHKCVRHLIHYHLDIPMLCAADSKQFHTPFVCTIISSTFQIKCIHIFRLSAFEEVKTQKCLYLWLHLICNADGRKIFNVFMHEISQGLLNFLG